ncbi:general stress protein [Planctomyces sp. SH-PL14]|uniref:general stress protein n=1 Tax=Planctomyces sp. SH-PL14 TaxID=1632864 RepID=UPI000946327A|nr:general stress protein [Planctomyces sp. SH-PL14]
MTTSTTTLGTVVGSFESEAQAQRAVNALRGEGFTEDEIGIVAPNSTTGVSGTATATKAEEGAVAGLATGAALGAVWGMGILAGMIPGIGPAIAGGTLAALLSSAGAGAAAAGVAGALIGMGIPEKDATYYDAEYGRGRSIVTVRGGRTSEARAILDANGALRRV